MKLYNTLTRKKEEFIPLKKGVVGFYSCGPTVYNYAHIGNLRHYVFNDLLQRSLEYNGYKVKRVINITDVGHLTSDSDNGEDKMEKGAKKENKSPQEIAKFYTQAFWRDSKNLNIKKPKIIVPASKTIKEQIAIIKKLFAKGYAYETNQAVYFHVPKFKDYGKLSGQSLSQKLTAARSEVVEDKEKKHPADFVLWFKLVGRHAHHIMHWPSPWGEGFPGWHIECSAISSKYLGQPFDIHSGGVDHIGTHHTNEIAQSEAAFNKPLAKLWMHGEFLLIDQGKMAKSDGNFTTLSSLIDKGFSALDFRYLCLTAHYRSRLNFSWESLESAKNARQNLMALVSGIQKERATSVIPFHVGTGRDLSLRAGDDKKWSVAGIQILTPQDAGQDYIKKFNSFINDDLNAPRALALLWDVLQNKKLSSRAKLGLVREYDKVLGLDIIKQSKSSKSEIKIPAPIKQIADKRYELRKAKKYSEADKLRLELAKKGYIVEDKENSFRLTKAIISTDLKK